MGFPQEKLSSDSGGNLEGAPTTEEMRGRHSGTIVLLGPQSRLLFQKTKGAAWAESVPPSGDTLMRGSASCDGGLHRHPPTGRFAGGGKWGDPRP